MRERIDGQVCEQILKHLKRKRCASVDTRKSIEGEMRSGELYLNKPKSVHNPDIIGTQRRVRTDRLFGFASWHGAINMSQPD